MSKKAEDIMTKEVITIDDNALVSEAIQLMKDHNVHALIVKPRGYGIVTEADIAYKVIASDADPKSLTVGDIMTKSCITIKPGDTVEEVAQTFRNSRIHRAPVVEGDIKGVVSVSDVLKATVPEGGA